MIITDCNALRYCTVFNRSWDKTQMENRRLFHNHPVHSVTHYSAVLFDEAKSLLREDAGKDVIIHLRIAGGDIYGEVAGWRAAKTTALKTEGTHGLSDSMTDTSVTLTAK